ncbi:MAG: N-6 DNA methylase, partial [Tolypothrix sp. Co-bin9]|nr:N-6 DNA methylase [Tolypothrix sp. Co-bin9]
MLQSSRKYLTENHQKLLQFNTLAESFSRDLLGEVDLITIIARAKQNQKKKETLGQFLTPASVAGLMAGMFEKFDYPQISLLDAGAGSGSLLAAFVANLCHQQQHPINLDIVAYEIDPFLIKYLRKTLKLCARKCQLAGISFNYEIRERDFIEDAVTIVNDNSIFTHAILNPPY